MDTNLAMIVAALLTTNNITIVVSNAPMDKETYIQQFCLSSVQAGTTYRMIEAAEETYNKIYEKFHPKAIEQLKNPLREERKNLEKLREQKLEKE